MTVTARSVFVQMLSPASTEQIPPANEISILYAIRKKTALNFPWALNKFEFNHLA